MTCLIRTTGELEAACAQVRAAGVLALDTEFAWRNTYRPRLGIVQMGAGGDASWAIDVLQGLNSAALADVITDASVVKILHDARQDLQHLRHYCGAFPQNVFDTQLAADLALDWLDARAEELHVAPGIIANRATVTAFVDNVEDGSNPLSGGWRWEVVGREMSERFGVD